jgi:hypothetical protein
MKKQNSTTANFWSLWGDDTCCNILHYLQQNAWRTKRIIWVINDRMLQQHECMSGILSLFSVRWMYWKIIEWLVLLLCCKQSIYHFEYLRRYFEWALLRCFHIFTCKQTLKVLKRIFEILLIFLTIKMDGMFFQRFVSSINWCRYALYVLLKAGKLGIHYKNNSKKARTRRQHI